MADEQTPKPKTDFAERFWRIVGRLILGYVILGIVVTGCRDFFRSDPVKEPATSSSPSWFISGNDRLEEMLDRMEGSTFLGIVCSDGWRSPSVGRGTCSHHGGMRWELWRRADGTEVSCPVRSAALCP